MDSKGNNIINILLRLLPLGVHMSAEFTSTTRKVFGKHTSAAAVTVRL